MQEPIGWITVNGNHIPLFEGDSKESAVKRWAAGRAKQEEDKKEAQISYSRAEAEKKNNEDKPLPKRLILSNIKITKDNVDDKRVMLGVGTKGPKRKFDFAKGSEIRNAYVFAGKGCSKEFRDAWKYADRYRHLGLGKSEDWQHCAGTALLTDGTRSFVREVHWIQGKDGVIREAFIKVRH